MSATSTSGERAMLMIFPCTVQTDGSVVVGTTAAFKVQVNPSGFDHNYTVRYSNKKALGSKGGESKFDAMTPEEITLKPLVLDGTGAVPGPAVSVTAQVEKLREAVYGYVGKEHEPPIVHVVWGSSLMFQGRIKNLKFEYTLFTPTGEPLRARVSLAFVGYTTPAQEVKEKAASSPDLTHLIVVRAGDTLPLLCERIYRNPAYHLQVARINGLTQVRQLEPGMSLRFPPLV